MPKRIQLKRTKGWRLADISDNVVIVDRRGKWGNPFPVSEFGLMQSLALYEAWVRGWAMQITVRTRELIGNRPLPNFAELHDKDLACWCKLCEKHKDGKPLDEDCPDCAPCHVDVIGKLLYKNEVKNEG